MYVQKKFLVLVFLVTGILLNPRLSLGEYNFAFGYSQRSPRHRLFLRPEVESSLYKFAKELQLNPKNQTAEENFTQISSYPRLAVEQKIQVLAIEGLFSYVHSLREKVFYLTSRRDFLKDQLLSKGYDRGLMTDGFLNIKENTATIDSSAGNIEPSLVGESQALEIIINILSNEKKRLSDNIELIQTQYSWLKEMDDRQQYFSPESDRYRAKDVIFSKKTQKLESKGKSKNSLEIEKKEDEVKSAFSKDLAGNLNGSNKKVKELLKQLIDLSLKISESETLLSEKVEEITSLQERLLDAEQRFILGQRIIHEKNVEIESLQASQKGMEASRTALEKKNAQITSLRYQLMVERFDRNNKKQETSTIRGEEDIISLKNQLAGLRADLGSQRGNAKRTQESLGFLRSELEGVQIELLRLQDHFPGDKQKHSDLGNQLEKLQVRFKDIQDFFLENLNTSDKMKVPSSIN